MARREALRATALVAARASLEAQITMVHAVSAVQAASSRSGSAASSAYGRALTQAQLRAARG